MTSARHQLRAEPRSLSGAGAGRQPHPRRITPHAIDEHAWGVQTVWKVYVELEDSPKPCVVAEWVTRAYR